MYALLFYVDHKAILGKNAINTKANIGEHYGNFG